MSDALPPASPSATSAVTALSKRTGSWARASLGLKVVAIGFVVLVLLVPLGLLGGLIAEREQMRDTARRDVAGQWGQPQTVGGPVLTIPYAATLRDPDGTARTETRYVHVFPDVLEADGTLTPEVRTRGIFRVVLYNTDVVLTGRFPDLDSLGSTVAGVPRSALRVDEAFVQIGLPDLVGVRETIRVEWGGAALEADPGIATADVFGSGVSVRVPLPAGAGQAGSGGAAMPFRVALDLNGSREFGLLPVGRETRLRLASPWATPRFAGAFLPHTRDVSADGFAAEWRVLHLNRNYPQVFAGAFRQPTTLTEADPTMRGYPGEPGPTAGASAFGVELLLPVDAYQKTSRAAKYGALFVFLAFLTFFFVEVLAGRRFHPVQYLLVGLAVSIFYLLLLAFAEHIPFGAAYAGAAALSVGLVTLYARAAFGEWRLAALVGGLLAVFSGYFYVLLQMETYALLVGSLGLFATLAATMYLSRRVEWYGEAASD